MKKYRLSRPRVAATMILAVFLWQSARIAVADGPSASSDKDSIQVEVPLITTEKLSNRSFKFFWRSAEGGALNGVATLRADGSIDGIGSPNESKWTVDESGKLLFWHADGRVTTRYLTASLTDGVLCLEGPFLLGEGIQHYLVEVGGPVEEVWASIQPEQAGRIKYSKQSFVYLDINETCEFRLRDGTTRTIRLKSVEEARDNVIGLVRFARVVIDVDDQELVLSCAPYVMPTQCKGLRIQADTTSEWMKIPKRVQFSLWDAVDAIVDTNLFCFPLPNYRLFSLGTQAYNEPVHLGHRDGDPQGQKFYHNYGVDFAGYEGRQKVVSCISGKVVQLQTGEGTLAIQDDQGIIFVYGHLDTVLSDIKVGTNVRFGQWIGMVGKRGASGNFSHLHVGTYLSEPAMVVDRMNRNLNLYPWLVAAYRAQIEASPIAVARPHHTVRLGETVTFDGSNSLVRGSKIESYRWEFPDGTHVDHPTAEKVFDNPGCYIASLWIKDSDGNVDVDFCRVKVFSNSIVESGIPTLFVTCTPAGSVRVGQPVSFRIWPQGAGVEAIEVDFGDETRISGYRPFTAVSHTYFKPGVQVVTVAGRSHDFPVAQKVKIVVHE
jgi:murein DD-endopeptidase MepM/ murein hydrolase activator NlpD